jgi:hypothetical protein
MVSNWDMGTVAKGTPMAAPIEKATDTMRRLNAAKARGWQITFCGADWIAEHVGHGLIDEAALCWHSVEGLLDDVEHFELVLAERAERPLTGPARAEEHYADMRRLCGIREGK